MTEEIEFCLMCGSEDIETIPSEYVGDFPRCRSCGAVDTTYTEARK